MFSGTSEKGSKFRSNNLQERLLGNELQARQVGGEANKVLVPYELVI